MTSVKFYSIGPMMFPQSTINHLIDKTSIIFALIHLTPSFGMCQDTQHNDTQHNYIKDNYIKDNYIKDNYIKDNYSKHYDILRNDIGLDDTQHNYIKDNYSKH
jgi:hypothetical protein